MKETHYKLKHRVTALLLLCKKIEKTLILK